MSAYLPCGSGGALAALLVAATLLAALWVSRLRSRRAARAAGWTLAFVAVAAAHLTASGQPAGFRMIVIVVVLLLAMKAVVSVEATAREGTRLAPLRWLAFAALWPGMRPCLFARREGGRPGAWRLIAGGAGHAVTGAALIALARIAWRATGSPILATLVLLPGLSLLVHFGVFGMLAGAWRLAGAETSPLFHAPLRSASLGEFWSRRWNVAFSEMTALGVYRPLSAAMGRRAALVAGFLVSGLLHEAAISLPVGAGFGGPLTFFALHGALTAIERERGPFGRVATLASVILPAPLLFHLPFLRGVVWPLLGAGT